MHLVPQHERGEECCAHFNDGKFATCFCPRPPNPERRKKKGRHQCRGHQVELLRRQRWEADGTPVADAPDVVEVRSACAMEFVCRPPTGEVRNGEWEID